MKRIEWKSYIGLMIFAGLVDNSEIPGYLSIMDLAVHASLREGLPRVLPQALLAGVPVISFALDGAPETIEDGVTGKLVEPENSKELAKAIIAMLSDPSAAKKMAVEGRKLFV